ncbi:phosphoglycolate phosphatase haloacid dehalogenase hydrolase [Secundilactobacillus pentosiphilus]|uniref:Phosphoglycolate phosphatase haloacid dehalogenase hydrolase n=1 Tax=Secundilactobacillus pentosiphilus TaxID=1714682 RepID=A0A1Z5IXU4_9LACO|nr:HAD family hydrolase [Secundilactobacillus pentosiphilus]GAX03273.1 phosphoglycolate phosphatase haloacid dehalogenase hydrolase [Secundilactobacillus pentosiphilus]GAX06499.1 phosphoglycolate phosphatase haloacid dehalogenase hydrolase [Secundilactobacillus pentosiphilus]
MKNFIFDVDGTLLDTEAMYMKALDKVLRQHQIKHPYSELAATFGITSLDALKRLKVPADLISPILNEWAQTIPEFQHLTHVYDGIEEMLSNLSKQPGTQLAIMTSKQKYEFKRDVTPLGLDKYFSQFVFFEDAKRGKPAPDPILVAIDRLNADPKETIYIGDTQYDLQAAHAAGVKFGLVVWQTKPSKKLADADVVLTTPEDLLAMTR